MLLKALPDMFHHLPTSITSDDLASKTGFWGH